METGAVLVELDPSRTNSMSTAFTTMKPTGTHKKSLHAGASNGGSSAEPTDNETRPACSVVKMHEKPSFRTSALRSRSSPARARDQHTTLASASITNVETPISFNSIGDLPLHSAAT